MVYLCPTDNSADSILYNMRLLIRLLQRVLVLGLGVLSVWLIVFVIFEFADHRGFSP